jgi:hypothetical protein
MWTKRTSRIVRADFKAQELGPAFISELNLRVAANDPEGISKYLFSRVALFDEL